MSCVDSCGTCISCTELIIITDVAPGITYIESDLIPDPVSPDITNIAAAGPQGIQGTQGTQGIQGLGFAQLQGTLGLQGVQGNTGSNGSQGTTGTTGIQGVQGTQGVQGITAAVPSSDAVTEGSTNLYFRTDRVAYVHTQGVSSSTWTIPHNLGFFPNLTVQDSSGTIYEGEISHTNSGSLSVSFSAAFSGKAYLS
jgi:hypothetical protein